MNHFPRTALARTLADGLEGRAVVSDAANGLFLAAHRLSWPQRPSYRITTGVYLDQDD